MLGLDAAGKTTVLYKLKLNETVMTIPTIGFNVETVEPLPGVRFTVWDVGGQQKIRALWKPYFHGSEGLLYVVDSLDRERLTEAKDELFGILDSDEMQGVPFVVLANKQDLNNAMKPSDLIDGLCLRQLGATHKWHIQGTCATTGEGVHEAVQAMSNLTKEFRKNNRH